MFVVPLFAALHAASPSSCALRGACCTVSLVSRAFETRSWPAPLQGHTHSGKEEAVKVQGHLFWLLGEEKNGKKREGHTITTHCQHNFRSRGIWAVADTKRKPKCLKKKPMACRPNAADPVCFCNDLAHPNLPALPAQRPALMAGVHQRGSRPGKLRAIPGLSEGERMDLREPSCL